MNYAAETLAVHLKKARENKGLSQRELSVLAGVPQSHISKIENKAVDLRVSSLSAIAHALDLGLVLVPRKALPAVNSITRSVSEKQIVNSEIKRELDRIKAMMRSARSTSTRMGLRDVQQDIRTIEAHQAQISDLGSLRVLRQAIEKAGGRKADAHAANLIHEFRNQLIHTFPIEKQNVSSRPAYRLGDDDE